MAATLNRWIELRWNNYQNRYHDMHLDLMDALSGYGASSRVGLGNWCRTIGLPGKSFIERQVYEHVLDGELPRVIEYCKLDAVQTMLAFLVFAHHRGDLDFENLRRYVAGVRAAVDAEPYEGWRDVAAALEGWPRWAASGPPPE